MCWIGILILNGGHFVSSKGAIMNVYRRPPHGIRLPYVQNAMPRNVFEFARRYIHFYDNTKRVAKGLPGYDALYKVSYPFEQEGVEGRERGNH